MTSTIETRNKTNAEAIGAWHTALTTGAPLTRREARLILSAINDSLPCRDALVLSCCDDELSETQLDHLAKIPRDAQQALLMDDIFSRLLNGTLKPKPATTEHAGRLLDQLARAATGKQAAQPLAMRAWIAWVTDDLTTAEDFATQSLTIDEDTRLSALVLFGAQLHIHVGETA